MNERIPKVKNTKVKDHLQQVDPKKPDIQKLLREINLTCLDKNFDSEWELKAVSLVHNAELEENFIKKRGELKEEGRSSQSLLDNYGFLVAGQELKVSIASKGLRTSRKTYERLGKGKCGVYINRHFDVELKSAWSAMQSTKEIIVFKYFPGKRKAITVNKFDERESTLEPTPNFDSHISSVTPTTALNLFRQNALSSIYLYEYTDTCESATYPRQCLPFAVIKCFRRPKPVLNNQTATKRERQIENAKPIPPKISAPRPDEKEVSHKAGTPQEHVAAKAVTAACGSGLNSLPKAAVNQTDITSSTSHATNNLHPSDKFYKENCCSAPPKNVGSNHRDKFVEKSPKHADTVDKRELGIKAKLKTIVSGRSMEGDDKYLERLASSHNRIQDENYNKNFGIKSSVLPEIFLNDRISSNIEIPNRPSSNSTTLCLNKEIPHTGLNNNLESKDPRLKKIVSGKEDKAGVQTGRSLQPKDVRNHSKPLTVSDKTTSEKIPRSHEKTTGRKLITLNEYFSKRSNVNDGSESQSPKDAKMAESGQPYKARPNLIGTFQPPLRTYQSSTNLFQSLQSLELTPSVSSSKSTGESLPSSAAVVHRNVSQSTHKDSTLPHTAPVVAVSEKKKDHTKSVGVSDVSIKAVNDVSFSKSSSSKKRLETKSSSPTSTRGENYHHSPFDLSFSKEVKTKCRPDTIKSNSVEEQKVKKTASMLATAITNSYVVSQNKISKQHKREAYNASSLFERMEMYADSGYSSTVSCSDQSLDKEIRKEKGDDMNSADIESGIDCGKTELDSVCGKKKPADSRRKERKHVSSNTTTNTENAPSKRIDDNFKAIDRQITPKAKSDMKVDDISRKEKHSISSPDRTLCERSEGSKVEKIHDKTNVTVNSCKELQTVDTVERMSIGRPVSNLPQTTSTSTSDIIQEVEEKENNQPLAAPNSSDVVKEISFTDIVQPRFVCRSPNAVDQPRFVCRSPNADIPVMNLNLNLSTHNAPSKTFCSPLRLIPSLCSDANNSPIVEGSCTDKTFCPESPVETNKSSDAEVVISALPCSLDQSCENKVEEMCEETKERELGIIPENLDSVIPVGNLQSNIDMTTSTTDVRLQVDDIANLDSVCHPHQQKTDRDYRKTEGILSQCTDTDQCISRSLSHSCYWNASSLDVPCLSMSSSSKVEADKLDISCVPLTPLEEEESGEDEEELPASTSMKDLGMSCFLEGLLEKKYQPQVVLVDFEKALQSEYPMSQCDVCKATLAEDDFTRHHEDMSEDGEDEGGVKSKKFQEVVENSKEEVVKPVVQNSNSTVMDEQSKSSFDGQVYPMSNSLKAKFCINSSTPCGGEIPLDYKGYLQTDKNHTFSEKTHPTIPKSSCPLFRSGPNLYSEINSWEEMSGENTSSYDKQVRSVCANALFPRGVDMKEKSLIHDRDSPPVGAISFPPEGGNMPCADKEGKSFQMDVGVKEKDVTRSAQQTIMPHLDTYLIQPLGDVDYRAGIYFGSNLSDSHTPVLFPNLMSNSEPDGCAIANNFSSWTLHDGRAPSTNPVACVEVDYGDVDYRMMPVPTQSHCTESSVPSTGTADTCCQIKSDALDTTPIKDECSVISVNRNGDFSNCQTKDLSLHPSTDCKRRDYCDNNGRCESLMKENETTKFGQRDEISEVSIDRRLSIWPSFSDCDLSRNYFPDQNKLNDDEENDSVKTLTVDNKFSHDTLVECGGEGTVAESLNQETELEIIVSDEDKKDGEKGAQTGNERVTTSLKELDPLVYLPMPATLDHEERSDEKTINSSTEHGEMYCDFLTVNSGSDRTATDLPVDGVWNKENTSSLEGASENVNPEISLRKDPSVNAIGKEASHPLSLGEESAGEYLCRASSSKDQISKDCPQPTTPVAEPTNESQDTSIRNPVKLTTVSYSNDSNFQEDNAIENIKKCLLAESEKKFRKVLRRQIIDEYSEDEECEEESECAKPAQPNLDIKSVIGKLDLKEKDIQMLRTFIEKAKNLTPVTTDSETESNVQESKNKVVTVTTEAPQENPFAKLTLALKEMNSTKSEKNLCPPVESSAFVPAPSHLSGEKCLGIKDQSAEKCESQNIKAVPAISEIESDFPDMRPKSVNTLNTSLESRITKLTLALKEKNSSIIESIGQRSQSVASFPVVPSLSNLSNGKCPEFRESKQTKLSNDQTFSVMDFELSSELSKNKLKGEKCQTSSDCSQLKAKKKVKSGLSSDLISAFLLSSPISRLAGTSLTRSQRDSVLLSKERRIGAPSNTCTLPKESTVPMSTIDSVLGTAEKFKTGNRKIEQISHAPKSPIHSPSDCTNPKGTEVKDSSSSEDLLSTSGCMDRVVCESSSECSLALSKKSDKVLGTTTTTNTDSGFVLSAKGGSNSPSIPDLLHDVDEKSPAITIEDSSDEGYKKVLLKDVPLSALSIARMYIQHQLESLKDEESNDGVTKKVRDDKGEKSCEVVSVSDSDSMDSNSSERKKRVNKSFACKKKKKRQVDDWEVISSSSDFDEDDKIVKRAEKSKGCSTSGLNLPVGKSRESNYDICDSFLSQSDSSSLPSPKKKSLLSCQVIKKCGEFSDLKDFKIQVDNSESESYGLKKIKSSEKDRRVISLKSNSKEYLSPASSKFSNISSSERDKCFSSSESFCESASNCSDREISPSKDARGKRYKSSPQRTVVKARERHISPYEDTCERKYKNQFGRENHYSSPESSKDFSVRSGREREGYSSTIHCHESDYRRLTTSPSSRRGESDSAFHHSRAHEGNTSAYYRDKKPMKDFSPPRRVRQHSTTTVRNERQHPLDVLTRSSKRKVSDADRELDYYLTTKRPHFEPRSSSYKYNYKQY